MPLSWQWWLWRGDGGSRAPTRHRQLSEWWRQTAPNVAYLVNALRQTGYEGEMVNADNWRRIVAARVEAVDWPGVVADVDPFLLREADATALRKDRLLQLLGE